MTPIKRRLLYIFRGSLLRLRITWNHGESLTLSVGYNVDKADSKGKPKWDGSRCVRNTTHGSDKVPAATINRSLEILEEKIDHAFYTFEAADIIPSKEQLKEELSGKRNNDVGISFDQAFNEFLSEGSSVSQWSEGTSKKMKTIGHLMKKFRPDLQLSDLDSEFLDSIMAYQTSNAVVDAPKEKTSEKGRETIAKYKGRYQNSTINRNMRFIRWFIRWCVKKGYVKDSDFAVHRNTYKTPRNQIVFLNWDELMKVYNMDLSSSPDLELTRDMFCFCCFTSLRYSDLVNLHWSNVSDDCITVTTIKTTDTVIIDLNDYSREILDKYAGRRSSGGTVFPKKSSQKMNDGLKKIARECGITEPVRIVQMFGSERKEITLPKYELVTTHCGRRTFICNALSLGISPNVVMEWTGHSDYKAMKPYIAIADNIRKKSMGVFNKKGDS